MPGSRAADLRAALQEVLGTPVQLFPAQHGSRISAVAPAGDDFERWRRVIALFQDAHDWGSSTAGGTPEIWAEVRQEP